jgi:hypothetical protein
MKLREFNLFSDKSAQIFLIFPQHLPEFPWFSKLGGGGGGGGSCPLSRTPMSQRLFINLVLHRHVHVCIVFLPNPPIAISNLPYCSSHGKVTFLKHCFWLVGQKHNTHVTVKD